jgi:hypothetical protein
MRRTGAAVAALGVSGAVAGLVKTDVMMHWNRLSNAAAGSGPAPWWSLKVACHQGGWFGGLVSSMVIMGGLLIGLFPSPLSGRDFR